MKKNFNFKKKHHSWKGREIHPSCEELSYGRGDQNSQRTLPRRIGKGTPGEGCCSANTTVHSDLSEVSLRIRFLAVAKSGGLWEAPFGVRVPFLHR